MNEVTFRSDFDVELVTSAGDDQLVCQAARVSTLGAASIETSESAGLINFLEANRHGSPFEHGFMCFRISAPIFVWREFMRHRIGWSYNEQSGRYMEMIPVFYIPPPHRPLTQVGKPGAYEFVRGSADQYTLMRMLDQESYINAWGDYQKKLQAGIAKEVARNNIPVAIYSSAYVSCNPRSMMAFLSLRTKSMHSMFPSYPQWEINQVANQMESIFKKLFPMTWDAFDANGRVSP